MIISSPRHAQVIPSCLVPLFKRPLRLSGRSISPADLVNWPPGEPLTDEEKEALLDQVIKRLKTSPGLVYSTRVGVPLHAEWRSVCPPELIPRIENAVGRIMASDIRPEDATIEQIKLVVNMPLRRVIRMLAKVEALSWDELNTVDVIADDLLQWKLRQVREIPWIGQVGADDVRFRARDGLSLAQAFEALGEAHEMCQEDANLVRSVYRADRMSFRQELLDISLAAESRVIPPGWRSNGKYARIFVERYIGPDGVPQETSAVANRFNLTSERVRQVCAKMLAAIGTQGQSVAPTTSRLLAFLSSRQFSSGAEGAECLFGDGVKEEAVFRFAADIGVQVQLSHCAGSGCQPLLDHYRENPFCCSVSESQARVCEDKAAPAGLVPHAPGRCGP